ncbi:MAG: hypothetical protein M3O36_08080 [Myxococcota bacterium]|nr:hypothetical protein [Myxococcota bacterium]
MRESKRKFARGLTAIAQAREDRANGRSRWTMQAGFVAAAAVLGGLVTHKIVSDREVHTDRQALLAKQRAVATTLGADWFPLRDKLEAEVLASAKEYAGDLVDARARHADFRSQPGLYLRMRLADAKDTASIRAVASLARRDAFAACLLREPNVRGAHGDTGGGAFAEQPWNLGRAYASTRILTDEWVREVQNADEDLRLRVFAQQYEKAVSEELPLAIEVVKRAQFFLLVLDEDVPEAATPGDAGARTVSEDSLQLVEHPARVHLLDLVSGKETLRLRRSGNARLVPAGERMITDPEMRDAMQRQANNCALAARVLDAL